MKSIIAFVEGIFMALAMLMLGFIADFLSPKWLYSLL